MPAVKPCLELEKTVGNVTKAIAKIEKTEKERSKTIKQLTSTIEDFAAKQVTIVQLNHLVHSTILVMQVDIRTDFVNAKDVLEVCLEYFFSLSRGKTKA